MEKMQKENLRFASGSSGNEAWQRTETETSDANAKDHFEKPASFESPSIFEDFQPDDCSTFSTFMEEAAEEERSEIEAENLQGGEKPLSGASSWQVMLGIVSATGSRKISVAQFSFFRNSLNWVLSKHAPKEREIPSYSALQRLMDDRISGACFPKSFMERRKMHPPLSEASSIPELPSASKKANDENAAMFALPSEWAKADATFGPFLEASKEPEKSARCDTPMTISPESLNLLSKAELQRSPDAQIELTLREAPAFPKGGASLLACSKLPIARTMTTKNDDNR